MKRIACFLLAITVLALCGCAEHPVETTEATTAPTEQTTVATTEKRKPDKIIALTFDDGPNNLMPKLLAVLEKYDAKATFFLIGSKIDMNTAQVIRQAYNAGHEIANHSFSHVDMSSMNAEEVEYEFRKVQDTVKQITGEEPKFFRPPFLQTSQIMFDTVDVPMISGRTVCDYSGGTAAQIADDAIQNANDGRIILMHVMNPTIEALDTILPWLYKYGFETVTVSELFERKGIDPTTNDILYLDECSQ